MPIKKTTKKETVETVSEIKEKKTRKAPVKKSKAVESETQEITLEKTAITLEKQVANSASEKEAEDKKDIKCITDAMLDKKAQGVCSLDLSKIGTAICDYFVICHADSRPQVMAIADNVEEMMYKECNRKVIRMQGKENAFWIIIDYGNIVVHVFQTEYRQFYRLEDLWADAEKTIYQD